jgi:hypothetical protein
MKKDKKKAVTNTPQIIENGQRADTDSTEIAANLPGGSKNEETLGAADMATPIGAEVITDDLFSNTPENTYSQSPEEDTTRVIQENYPEATSQADTGSNSDIAPASFADTEVPASFVEENTAKPTGIPADIVPAIQAQTQDADSSPMPTKKAISASTKKKSPSKQVSRTSRMYGMLHKEGAYYFIKSGNVPQEQLLVRYSAELEDQLDRYNGQYVSIAGELAQKNKAGSYAAIHIHKLASHDQIGQRAYELSQQNPDAHEANWLSAENELLQF